MLTKFFSVLVLSAVLLGAASDGRLSEAAMQGNKELVRSLLKERVDVDGPQGDGSTALHWAAFHDDLDMVKMLLAAARMWQEGRNARWRYHAAVHGLHEWQRGDDRLQRC